MKTTLLLFFAFCLLAVTRAEGFAYHGSLREANGTKFNTEVWLDRSAAERTFIFALYTTAAGNGAPVWQATFEATGAHAVTPDTNGNFTVSLNEGISPTGDPLDFFTAISTHTSATLYLGITVGTGTQELSPRQEILSVPYAAYAELVEGESYTFTAEETLTIGKEFDVNGKLTLTQLETVNAEFRGTCDVSDNVSATELAASGEAEFMDAVTAGSIFGYGAIPVGGIVPFFNETEDIPEGWALCNGENGTPDLSNQFILGAKPEDNAYPVFSSGGSETVTLTEANLPPHTHTHTRDIYRNLYDFVCSHSDDGNNRWRATTLRNGDSSTGVDKNGASLSSSPTPITILPPYIQMRFIMRVK